MSIDLLISAPLGLLPVMAFLATLVWLDSYKLVGFRTVLSTVIAGALLTLIGYFVNASLMGYLLIDFTVVARYLAPLVEEFLKALVVIYLFRTNRIGFLVDGAILGFAVGAGFALAENLFYLYSVDRAHIAVWLVRGFGTAIMHGGVTAIFAILSQVLTERNMNVNPLRYVPGLAVAVALHSLFNHFVLPPVLMTLVTLVLLPPLLYAVFRKSAAHMHEWLELDFDADALLLDQINSGDFAHSKVGRFLHDLRSRFEGPVVVDMLCYLRLYTELALRAKGALLMRENGLDVPVGERTKDKFTELAFLERSIGKTAMLAMRPFLHMTRKDLWQMNVLER